VKNAGFIFHRYHNELCKHTHVTKYNDILSGWQLNKYAYDNAAIATSNAAAAVVAAVAVGKSYDSTILNCHLLFLWQNSWFNEYGLL